MTNLFLYLVMGLSAVQAVLMFIDEGIFHRRRGLGTFERYGHIADTLMFTATLAVPIFFAPEKPWLILYTVMAIGSCLLITKDEGIHAEVCGGAEQWCHAMLFILHGALLLSFGLLWFYNPHAVILRLLPLGTLAWAAYQHIYWNVYVRSRHQ